MSIDSSSEGPRHASRKFYDLPAIENDQERGDCGTDRASKRQKTQDNASPNSGLLNYINTNVIGRDKTFSGPYGLRKVLYCDHTASGQSLQFIEDYINGQVLPEYGNTHTTTTVTSLQTTLYRHEARDIIRNAVNASEYDSVIFVGSGCTAAVHKLIHALNLTKPPVVFVGPYEHHSNLLPWRELGATVIRVRETDDGLVDLGHLQEMLQKWHDSGRELIGCFAAASNVTGTLSDVDAITIVLHKHGALAFWDYATAGAYVHIDMNPVVASSEEQKFVYKDAVFISPHKFIGGVQTPGLLVAKKKLFCNPVPSDCGGGSVFFVRREGHRYLQEAEMREEGGTPAIVEAVRAGLVFQLKEAVTHEAIMAREEELCSKAIDAWKDCPNLVLLGSLTARRLPIFSFLVRHPQTGLFLHHNFVSSVLNDVFGIQSRGGCACAGPYAQDILGINEEMAKEIENLLVEDSRLDRVHLRRYREYSEKEILRPGFSRLNLAYFMSDEDVSFVIEAVKLAAEHAWKLLPQYVFNPETGEWRHKDHQVFKDRKWLGHISYQSGKMTFRTPPCPEKGPLPLDVDDCLEKARIIFEKAKKARYHVADQSILFDSCQHLRWFLLPSEASIWLQDSKSAASRSWKASPFQPPSYPKSGSSGNVGVLFDSSDSQQMVLLPGQTKNMKDVTQDSSTKVTNTGSSIVASATPKVAFKDLLEENLSKGFSNEKPNGIDSENSPNVQDVSCDTANNSDKMEQHQNMETDESKDNITDQKSSADSITSEISGSDKTSDETTEDKNSPILQCATGTCFLKRREKPAEEVVTVGGKPKWHNPPKTIFKPTVQAIEEFEMIKDKDRVLVCLSGGKDSLSLLHCLRQYQFYAKKKGINFDLGAVTIDPMTSSYDPSPLKGYLSQLNVPYFYEEQAILEAAEKLGHELASICSYCSRMKRGRIYHAARREKYNVLALGQHLDDLSESFLMSLFHNGILRTMKANYTVQEGDLRVIRPFVHVREKDLRQFAIEKMLPVIPENCPACFEAPKERHRMKQLLAGQEVLFPRLFHSLSSAIKPIMAINKTGMNAGLLFSQMNSIDNEEDEL